ncbi:hypothetical protein [Ktedonospora formicarum]|uniref:Protein kinase domain-containing protein n=1 Tax=Ktedonospora formicarum TaxID=2778364 RepID=A0A8J3MWZ6_9CHLR|nr:hypothetical protein [Ktedonospora formicarum]GHO49198.1 hypothetical protein KSX_73610 [Ktedonospora formicarum]
MPIHTKNAQSLQEGRYLIAHPLVRSEWLHEIAEAWWVGRAKQHQERREQPCLIAEIHMPLTGSALTRQLQPVLQTLLALQGHPQYLQLQDMFSEQAAHYFVFGLPQGQSLAGLMHTEAMKEEDVRWCCLSVIEALHTFAHLHARKGMKQRAYGGIHPSYLVLKTMSSDTRWILSQPALLLASGALDTVHKPHHFSSFFPYYPPEFSGQGDIRADLYALLACAYHALTGVHPHTQRQKGGAIQQAQWLNARVSPRMNAILTKGLHANSQERYQHPAELYEALGRNPAVLTTSLSVYRQHAPVATTPPTEPQQRLEGKPISVGTALTGPPSDLRQQPSMGGLPPFIFGPAEPKETAGHLRIEDLPPFSAAHEWRTALCWIGGLTLLEVVMLHFAR